MFYQAVFILGGVVLATVSGDGDKKHRFINNNIVCDDGFGRSYLYLRQCGPRFVTFERRLAGSLQEQGYDLVGVQGGENGFFEFSENTGGCGESLLLASSLGDDTFNFYDHGSEIKLSVQRHGAEIANWIFRRCDPIPVK